MKREKIVIKHELVVNMVRPMQALQAWQYTKSEGAWPSWLLPYLSFVPEPSTTEVAPLERPRFVGPWLQWSRFQGGHGIVIDHLDWFVFTGLLVTQPIAKYSDQEFRALFGFDTAPFG